MLSFKSSDQAGVKHKPAERDPRLRCFNEESNRSRTSYLWVLRSSDKQTLGENMERFRQS